VSGAGGKSAEREREGRGVGSGCHKIGLSGERQIGRSRSAHAPLTCTNRHIIHTNSK